MTPEEKERLKTLLISGGVSGGILGGAGSLLSGAKKFGSVGKAAAIGAGLSAALSGGSGMLGEALMPGGENDPQANTKKGALGGAVGGGLMGAGAGALLGVGGKGGLGRNLKAMLMNNFGRGVLAKNVGKIATPLGGAASLGALGAAVGGYQGSDEGMQMDFIENLKKQAMRDRQRQQMMGDDYA